MTPRRRALAGWIAVGGAAAAAGAGVAWWRYRPGPVFSEAETAFWALQLDDPQGAPVAMSMFQGRPLLVNFWATWCPPCVEELPLLNRFHEARSGQGWQVVGLAVDQPSAVRRFVQKLPLRFPVAMAGLGGTELSRRLGNPSGGLPYTVVFGAEGRVLHRKIGKVSEADLDQWAQLG